MAQQRPSVTSSQEASPEARASAMRNIIGTLALSGLRPSEDVIRWMDDFVAGEMTADELEDAIKAKCASMHQPRASV